MIFQSGYNSILFTDHYLKPKQVERLSLLLLTEPGEEGEGQTSTRIADPEGGSALDCRFRPRRCSKKCDKKLLFITFWSLSH